MMFHRRIKTSRQLAIGAILVLACGGGCGQSGGGGARDTNRNFEGSNSPTEAKFDLSAVHLISADPSDKAASTHAYWQNSNAIVQEAYKFKKPTGWFAYRPEGMPPALGPDTFEGSAAAYRAISTKLESLTARGVDEDALNAWSRVPVAYKSMAASLDSANSGLTSGKAISDAARGASGDVAGPITETANRIDRVAKEFRDANADLSRVRLLLESRYGTKEFASPRLY